MMIQSLMTLGGFAKMKLRKLFSDEKGEVNIVAIVVLIGIAVLLALIFKDQIVALLNKLFGTISENANNAVGGGGGGE
ncbi:MAG: Flp1 family type IVb pilin [Eubacteriales bacterium]|nr:Flp1 family type IVb pilin [Eubacteriales bacterium]